MDIARPDLKRARNRRRWLLGLGGLVVLALITRGLAKLEPAAPRVDRAQVWTDTVKRGEMLRQVRGNGTLVPEQIQYVQADTDGRIERIHVLAGAVVQADTLILELSNPELEQQAFDLEWQLKAAEAQRRQLKVQLESERLTQESTIASLRADHTQASLDAEADSILAKDGLVPDLTMKRSRAKAEDLQQRLAVELKRLLIKGDSDQAQLAVQEAEVEKLRASVALRRKQVAALKVRAGVEGVLQSVGDGRETLQVGQRMGPGTTLAKIVQPTRLKAEVKIPETQARDVQIGQRAAIDTRNGVIDGVVTRVDPAVQNGTVTVDVKLVGALPRGARPDLSVDGTIELERLEDVLYVGRPFSAQPDATIGLFRVNASGEADRVSVKLGRSSVSTIEVLEGLATGDVVVLSDMSQWDAFSRIKLK
ncbi:MAG: HlyD family efflux transporter periplasmic adaptor subunit [Verrucomicrobiae bacterium]|nr:HlyD family efflux transporter periplasmic adaptor subunit [Verrucomicrobiae bacterium]